MEILRPAKLHAVRKVFGSGGFGNMPFGMNPIFSGMWRIVGGTL